MVLAKSQIVTMKVVVQNLQKRSHLASDLIDEYDPDLLLAQEISLYSEEKVLFGDDRMACNVYEWVGYGTAIWTKLPATLVNIRRVDSPYADFGFIYKKTTIATYELNYSAAATACVSRNKADEKAEEEEEEEEEEIVSESAAPEMEVVSFHGYNGQPWKSLEKLLAHVTAVIAVLSSDPDSLALFAGDFNTWSQHHIDAVTAELANCGFRHAFSWPYPGRELPLDHVFIRGDALQADSLKVFSNKSDHKGAVFDLMLLSSKPTMSKDRNAESKL